MSTASERRIVTSRVLADVGRERTLQVVKWGDDSAKDHEDGTGGLAAEFLAAMAKADTDAAEHPTWRLILMEEVREAFAETDPALLRAELIQVAAVAVKWIEAIDRRIAQ